MRAELESQPSKPQSKLILTYSERGDFVCVGWMGQNGGFYEAESEQRFIIDAS